MTDHSAHPEHLAQLEMLALQLQYLAENGAVASAEILHRLNRAIQTIVENAVLEGAPVPDLATGDDPVVQEATPGR